ncbi:DsbA family protein [Brevibacillus sp. SYSU BS000544]|uniref:DsbA family protein n=1 Tax=Brevibacillus sp. SYSU BS000544 TaxID=3416443 RepID=UPI003CE58335
MKKLIYIYDAYCPWCYAFTPVVHQLYENYRDSFEFDVISGGMIIDDQVKSIGGWEKSESLRVGYQQISERTGVPFSEAFFDRIKDEEIVMNSEIPARALAVFREFKTSVSSIEFVHKLHNYLFLEGRNPNDEGFYRNLATHFQLDPELFIENMNKNYFQQQARYDFALAKQLQAETFPRLYLQTSDTYFYLLSKGYSDYKQIVQIIDKIEAAN